MVGGNTRRQGSRMMRKFSILAAGAFLGAAAATVTLKTDLLRSTSAVAANAETYRSLNLFGDIFEKIRTDYVEKPEERKLVEAAINGMLASLDPHSGYLDPKSFRDMDIDMRGRFGGLGIEVTMEEGVLKVVTPIDDTPAFRAGVMTNDIIRLIDGDAVQGLTLNQAVEKMRGPINTNVKLTVERPGRREPIEFTLTRSDIVVPAVRARMEGDDVGYIRISTFSEQTFDGLRRGIERAIADAPGDKLKGFVIDLRNNRGGRLDQAVLVSDAFLERGEIVSTRGRNAEETQRFNARAGDLTRGKPVVVLINGGSASAAEIVAGAIQDHKRGTVMGTRSFGKGSVQTIIPLGSNGALRLTTARYYTPSGKSIQAKGIDPDTVVLQEIPEELRGRDETRGEAGLRGHLSSGQGSDERSGSSSFIPTDRAKDKQLNAALDLLRGVKRDAAAAPAPAPANPAAPAVPATPAQRQN
jgi:carboxyl-terminal processing protease